MRVVFARVAAAGLQMSSQVIFSPFKRRRRVHFPPDVKVLPPYFQQLAEQCSVCA
jgi:hypothetical protein